MVQDDEMAEFYANVLIDFLSHFSLFSFVLQNFTENDTRC
jgi:hypothetical protein